MTQAQSEFAQQAPNQQDQQRKHDPRKFKPTSDATAKNDILLNNFLIKKRRFRVLLNFSKIVWQRLDAKNVAETEPKSKKEYEVETEQLAHETAYSNVVHIDDVVRVTRSASKHSTKRGTEPAPTEQFLTIHYAVRVIKSPTDCNRWRMRSLSFFNADPYIVEHWHAALNKLLERQCRVKSLIAFINPFGGRRQGLQAYERQCKPLFELAGIDVSCIISQRANQIRDILMNHDLSPYDAVCCVGGDGTVAEVINGLLFRSIRDQGMDERRPAFVPKPCLPVGIIPAGSTDTVAFSLHGTADVRTAAIHLLLGKRRGLDICSVQNGQGLLRFCASVLSYGYLGDVAAKSEKYRWMGTKRYEYTGVKAFLKNRCYDADLRILLPQAEHSHQPAIGSDIDSNADQTAATRCYANCQRCNEAVRNLGTALKKGITIPDDIMPPVSAERNVGIVPTSQEQRTPSSTKLQPQKDVAITHGNRVEINLRSIYNEGTLESDNFKENCDNDAGTRAIDSQIYSKSSTTVTNIDELHQRKTHNNKLQEPCDIPNSNNVENTPLKHQDTVFGNSPESPTTAAPEHNFSLHSNTLINNNVNDEESSQWKVVKGTFFMIIGANITCACERSPNGISRYGHLGDGHMDLILVRKTSLLNNVRFLINTMGSNGDIRNLPFVEVYRTSEFSFRALRPSLDEECSIRGSCQPITEMHSTDDDNCDEVSRWNCDGEVVSDLDITMRSHCQLVEVFMRGPQPYVKNALSQNKSRLCC